MDRSEQIREGLKNLAKKDASTMLGTVKSIDVNERTFVFVDMLEDGTELEYPDIRLRPVIDGKESITVFPKVGTWALVVQIEEDDDWMALSFGEVDKWRLKIGTTIIEQDATGLLIQKGSVTLRDALSEFIDEVMKIVVLQGTSPNVAALTAIKVKVQNVLKNAT